MSGTAVAGMAVVALGMVLTPGPNMMYLVSRSISQGWRAGMAPGGPRRSSSATCRRTPAGGCSAQGFVLGGVQISVSLLVNALIVLAAGAVAAFLQRRPTWMRWQRRVTGTLLGAVGVRLAVDAPAPAH